MGGGGKEKKAKQQSPNFSLLCFLSTHRFEGKHFSAFWNSNVYVLPRQRAYRSVQTTEFKAWTWVFFFFYVVPCYVAFFVRQPIPPSLVVVVVALELFNPHSFWKIFSVLFLPFVILRISLRRRHTNKWFVSYASVKTFLLFSHCCRCFFFRWRAAKKNGRKETKMGRCCVIRTVCVFRYRREGKKRRKIRREKNDPADALTVVVVSVQLVFLTLAPHSRSYCFWWESFFALSLLGRKDVVLWLFYGIRHKHNRRSWWSGKFSLCFFFCCYCCWCFTIESDVGEERGSTKSSSFFRVV